MATLKEVISDFEAETSRMHLNEVLEEDHRYAQHLLYLYCLFGKSSLSFFLPESSNYSITPLFARNYFDLLSDLCFILIIILLCFL